MPGQHEAIISETLLNNVQIFLDLKKGTIVPKRYKKCDVPQKIDF